MQSNEIFNYLRIQANRDIILYMQSYLILYMFKVFYTNTLNNKVLFI